MDQRTRQMLAELKRGLEGIYGPRLKGVYLYGSYARGEQDAESDLDILVILDDVRDYGAELERTSYLISDTSLRHGVSVSSVFASERDWSEGHTPYLANARGEAVPA